MNPIKRLLGQTAIYGLSSILGRLLNFLLVPLYTRILAPDQYGEVTELYSYIGFLLVLLTYGMETAFFRFAGKDKKNSSQIFSSALIPLFFSSLSFIFLMSVFSENIAQSMGYVDKSRYYIWFAIILGLDAFTALPFARLRFQNKAIKFATIRFINIGVGIGLNLFFFVLCPYLLKNNPDSFLLSFYSPKLGVEYIFISNAVASILNLILLLPDLFKIPIDFNSQQFKKMFRYALPLVIAGFAGMINEMLDRVLLKHLLTIPKGVENSRDYVMSQLGIYGANYKLAVFMSLFIQTFRYAAEPFFFSQEKNKNSKKIYADVMKYFIAFGLLIFLGITLYMDIAKNFIGIKYHEALSIVPILLLANLCLGIVFNLSIWYKLTDKTKYGALIAIIGAIITIILNIILIPVISYKGSAWATLICYASMMIISYFIGKKYFPIKYDLKNIFIYITFALIIFFANQYFLRTDSFITNQIWATLSVILFLSLIVYKEKALKALISLRKKQ